MSELRNATTRELVDELATRPGVKEYSDNPGWRTLQVRTEEEFTHFCGENCAFLYSKGKLDQLCPSCRNGIAERERKGLPL